MPLTVIRGLSAGRRFDPDPSQVRHAREWARKALLGWGLMKHIDLVELLVSW
jgi:hypothetical protein